MNLLATLALLAIVGCASAESDRRAPPSGISPFAVTVPYGYGTFRVNALNQFVINNSGISFNVPAGAVEVDVLECDALSTTWRNDRGKATAFATSPVPKTTDGSTFTIVGYDPRDDSVSTSNMVAADCYNNPNKYWTDPRMAKNRGTYTVTADAKTSVVAHDKYTSSVFYNLVRYRSVSTDCVSDRGNFFIDKTQSVTPDGAAAVCSAKGGKVADVTFKNIDEANKLVQQCLGPNTPTIVHSWNGNDYGLGSMTYTSSASTTSGTGAVTIPDGQPHKVLCGRVEDSVRYSTYGQYTYVSVRGGIKYTDAVSQCASQGDKVPVVLPATADVTDKTNAWAVALTATTLQSGPFSNVWVGGYVGGKSDPASGICYQYSNGDASTPPGAITLPATGCTALLDGVLCGPKPPAPQKRSEL